MRNWKLWIDHFLQNEQTTFFPKEQKQHLDKKIASFLVPSLQQFQKGESSQGKTFLRFAQVFSDTIGDQQYYDSVRLFIREENRHSEMLKIFLQNCGYGIKEYDQIDSSFRRARKLVGIESMIRILLLAEIVAMTYYSAISNITENEQLRMICKQILSDESFHLTYQAQALALVKQYSFFPGIGVGIMRIGMGLTTCIVWFYHKSVFLHSGYSLKKVWKNNFFWLTKCEKND